MKSSKYVKVYHIMADEALYAADTCEELADVLDYLAAELREMDEAGVVLNKDGPGGNWLLSTEDKAIAKRFEFEREEVMAARHRRASEGKKSCVTSHSLRT
jgi:hypothetical protein